MGQQRTGGYAVEIVKVEVANDRLLIPVGHRRVWGGTEGLDDREAKRFAALPGADDPALVQSNPTWSPDGQWVVFVRTRAVQFKPAFGPAHNCLGILQQRSNRKAEALASLLQNLL